MVFRTDSFLAMLLAMVGGVAIASPAGAEVPWAWAKLSISTNQVSLLSASESRARPLSLTAFAQAKPSAPVLSPRPKFCLTTGH
jgi:hypothetical protein